MLKEIFTIIIQFLRLFLNFVFCIGMIIFALQGNLCMTVACGFMLISSDIDLIDRRLTK